MSVPDEWPYEAWCADSALSPTGQIRRLLWVEWSASANSWSKRRIETNFSSISGARHSCTSLRTCARPNGCATHSLRGHFCRLLDCCDTHSLQGFYMMNAFAVPLSISHCQSVICACGAPIILCILAGSLRLSPPCVRPIFCCPVSHTYAYPIYVPSILLIGFGFL